MTVRNSLTISGCSYEKKSPGCSSVNRVPRLAGINFHLHEKFRPGLQG